MLLLQGPLRPAQRWLNGDKETVEAESHSAADEVQLSQAGTRRAPKLPRKQLRGKMRAREGSSGQGRGTRSPYLKSFKMPPLGKLF